MQVMLVESHAPLAQLYQEELEEAGFKVRVCPDLFTAMAALDSDPVQVVVMGDYILGSRLHNSLSNLRKVHPGPVFALGPRSESGPRDEGVMLVPKSSDLGPLIRTLKGQAAAMLWNQAARA